LAAFPELYSPSPPKGGGFLSLCNCVGSEFVFWKADFILFLKNTQENENSKY